MQCYRKTKIIATLGPATSSTTVLEKLIKYVDIFRLNFSHGSHNDHKDRILKLRKIAQKQPRQIAFMADLQGPKIRIGKLINQGFEITAKQKIWIDSDHFPKLGTPDRLGIDYPNFSADVKTGQMIVLADGLLKLQILKIQDNAVLTQVIDGGFLSDRKGVNLLGGGLQLATFSEKDEQDLNFALSLGCEYLALSFVKTAADIENVRKKCLEQGAPSTGIIAKIERSEALDQLEAIIESSDGVMVARGDLAIEVGASRVPYLQKMIIKKARHLTKPVITATQMMESMIFNAQPTRAEVSDVANAILDGSDAVMLSAETASGAHPIRVVECLDEICRSAENHPHKNSNPHYLNHDFKKIVESIAMATMYIANRFHIVAIIAFTEHSHTPLWMSRVRSGIPIFGLSQSHMTLAKMALFRDVNPIKFDATAFAADQVEQHAIDLLVNHHFLQPGDMVIMTHGEVWGEHCQTNQLKILTVPAAVSSAK
jgi:pyruvate kinase